MANARDKSVDTTSLSLTKAAERGWIHRDYLAHVLRWNHIVKRVHSNFKDLHILDIGCGVEAPLPLTLFSNKLSHNGGKGSYTGVDYGKIRPHQSILNAIEKGSFNATFLSNFDFAKDELPRQGYNVVVCFEVLEHVEPIHAFKLLQRINKLILPGAGGTAYLSTPVYDEHVGAAANHVNEMSRLGLASLIKLAGLRVEHSYGTFASQKDYKEFLCPEERVLFDKLSDYYDANLLACIFAPLYPSRSRNCLWVVKSNIEDRLGTLIPETIVRRLVEDEPELHSSSDKWADHFQRIYDHVAKIRQRRQAA